MVKSKVNLSFQSSYSILTQQGTTKSARASGTFSRHRAVSVSRQLTNSSVSWYNAGPRPGTQNAWVSHPREKHITLGRCRANIAHIRQSRPDSGIDVQGKVLDTFLGVPSSLESGHLCQGLLANFGCLHSLSMRTGYGPHSQHWKIGEVCRTFTTSPPLERMLAVRVVYVGRSTYHAIRDQGS